VDPRFGKVGRQKIEDTGPLTAKRMETVDEEFLAATKGFVTKAAKAGEPFFVWFNPTRMHIYTHLKPESAKLAAPYSSDLDIHGSGMIEHDGHVGELLKLLDELKIADNTIVIYSSRQRRAGVLVARRRHHPLPRREGHHLGGRRARTDAVTLARPGEGGQRVQRHPVARGPVHHAGCRRRGG
jgi:hypothetical protein